MMKERVFVIPSVLFTLIFGLVTVTRFPFSSPPIIILL